MDINGAIAKNLKELRKREGLSMNSLAEKTGLSKAAISQIELGRGNPTIGTIDKLAQALRVPYSALLAPREAAAQVLFADEVPLEVAEDGSFRRYSYYKNTPQRDFEILSIELEPGCTQRIEATQGAVEYIILNKGIIIVEADELSYFMLEGDAISLSSEGGFVLKNDSSEKSQASWIRHFHS